MRKGGGVRSSVCRVVRSVCDVESFVTVLCSLDMRSHFFVHVCQKEALPSKYWVSSSWDRGEVVLIERGPRFVLVHILC